MSQTEAEPAAQANRTQIESGGRRGQGRKKRRGAASVSNRPVVRSTLAALPATVMTDLMIFFTLVFVYTSNPTGNGSALTILFNSLTTRNEAGSAIFSPALLLLLFFTWLMAAVIGLSVEALKQRRAPGMAWWLKGLALHAGVIGSGWLIYGLIQSSRLTPMSAGRPWWNSWTGWPATSPSTPGC